MNFLWTRNTALYLVLLLSVIRFLMVPMQTSLKGKKTMLTEYQELYLTKLSLRERQTGAGRDDISGAERERLAALLYPRESSFSAIQADIIKGLTAEAEKGGLTVINFELPDALVGKNISEANVILRLKGQTSAAIELLEGIKRRSRLLRIKGFETSRMGNDRLFTITVSAFRIEKR